jgi:O-antigen ligase
VKTSVQRGVLVGALAATAVTMPYSIRLCHWSFLLFVFCWILEGDWKTKLLLLKKHPLAWLLPLFFLMHVVAMAYTSNIESGLLQLEKKIAFILIPLTIASTPLITRKELGLVARLFIASCAVAAVYCLGHAGWVAMNDLPQNNFGAGALEEFQQLNPDASPIWGAFSYISLASGIQMHPTYFGLYLTVCLLLLSFFFRPDEVNEKEELARKILFVFFLLFIFLLSSRTAMLGALAVSITALAIRVPWPSLSRAIKVQVVLVLTVVLLVYVNPVSRYRGFQEPAVASVLELPDHTDTSIEIRLSLLKLSALAGREGSVWFGSGTGTAEDRMRNTATEHGISNVLGSFDPHNQFIYTYLDLGIAGLLCLAAVILTPLRMAWRRKSILHTGFTLVFACICLTESALELQKGIVLFTFFGSLFLFHEITPEERHYHHG